MHSTQKFSGRAADYTAGRPTYAVDGVLEMPNQTIAYIGKLEK